MDNRDLAAFEQTVQRLEEALDAKARLAERLEKLEAPKEIKVKRICRDNPAPARLSQGAAGWDLRVTQDIALWPDEYKVLPLGVRLAIPEGYAGQLWPRSGLALGPGIDRLAGLIDPDYRGEAKAILINHGHHRYEFAAGDRVCQLVVVPCLTQMIEVDDIDETERGEAGFGSTSLN